MDKEIKDKIFASIGGHFLVDLYSPLLPIILPALILNMNLSFFLAGLIVTAFNVTSSVVQPFAGLYSDRTGNSRTRVEPNCHGRYGRCKRSKLDR